MVIFLWYSSAWFTDCVTKFLSQRRRQDWEVSWGGALQLFLQDQDNKHFPLLQPLFYLYVYRKRKTVETSTSKRFFVLVSKCRQKAGWLARAGQCCCVISAFLTTPPQPRAAAQTQCQWTSSEQQ